MGDVEDLVYLAKELVRAIEYYKHYRTGTIKWIARDLAEKIARELC